jgi:YidC/Oxa1 family membrane protein insertase
VENGLYRVELSNRGGVVRSWQLKRYRDDSRPPRTLDVVSPEGGQQLGWPLSLALDDADLEQRANQALFEVTPASAPQVPGEVAFEWSDGRLHIVKRLRFDESYAVEISTRVTFDGQPLAHSLAWRGGFGDETAFGHTQSVRIFFRNGNTLQPLLTDKLGNPDNRSQRLRQEGTLGYCGIEDRYFAGAFLPSGGGSSLALWHWKQEREKTDPQNKERKEKISVAEMAAGSTVPGPLSLHLFVGPKDLDVLGRQKPPLTELADFGWDWLEPISKALFYLLKWIYGYVHNYGWAIVVMTIGINMLLFPLKVKSWRSMQKMQKVMPEIQAIKQRYAKYSLRDPRKQEEQKEMMAVYKREGINPAGGCLPMLLQMPVWFALYQMLQAAIELRHAPWIGWVRDLAAPDPYYILPVMMGVTMYVMQKMTPVTTPDPVQQRMLTMMPIIFGGMFVIVPISSGLVLYILASNLVGMGQQWFLNKTSPLKPPRQHDKKK